MNKLHEQNLYTTSQVAEILGVTRVTIFRWIKEGIIKATKVGHNYLISQEELHNHIERRPLNNEDKNNIEKLVNKVITDYGETIRMLGRE